MDKDTREELDSLINEQEVDQTALGSGDEQEDDAEVETEEDEEQDDTDARLKKLEEAYEAQRKRAEKAERKLRELVKNDKAEKHTEKEPYEELARRLVRTELRTLGVQTEEEFEFVERAAKLLGTDPVEALSDPVVSAKLEAMRREKREKQAATPSRSTSGGAQRKIDRIVREFEEQGIIPDDPKEFDALQEYLQKRR